MRIRWIIAGIVTAGAVAAGTASLFTLRARSISLKGAVILSHTDRMEESPIAGVHVNVADELALTSATSDFSGYFNVPLRADVVPGQSVTLQFRHPDYEPLDADVPAGDQLYVARL